MSINVHKPLYNLTENRKLKSFETQKNNYYLEILYMNMVKMPENCKKCLLRFDYFYVVDNFNITSL